MKGSIIFTSIVLSTFVGTMFFTQPVNISEKYLSNKKNAEYNIEKSYSECEKLIDSIKNNNEITKKNFNFVKTQLTQLK